VNKSVLYLEASAASKFIEDDFIKQISYQKRAVKKLNKTHLNQTAEEQTELTKSAVCPIELYDLRLSAVQRQSSNGMNSPVQFLSVVVTDWIYL
jgi:hypothetical protein